MPQCQPCKNEYGFSRFQWYKVLKKYQGTECDDSCIKGHSCYWSMISSTDVCGLATKGLHCKLSTWTDNHNKHSDGCNSSVNMKLLRLLIGSLLEQRHPWLKVS